MYDVSHINTTWGTKEVASHKVEDHHFGEEGVDPYRHHDISLHFIKGYSRHKTKVKIKRNLIQPFPSLIKNTKEIWIC